MRGVEAVRHRAVGLNGDQPAINLRRIGQHVCNGLLQRFSQVLEPCYHVVRHNMSDEVLTESGARNAGDAVARVRSSPNNRCVANAAGCLPGYSSR